MAIATKALVLALALVPALAFAKPRAGWNEFNWVLDSAHPYSAQGETLPITIQGAKRLKIHFARIQVEDRYDTLFIYDGAGNTVQQITGEVSDVTSSIIEGDTAVVSIQVDSSNEEWGFQVTKVFAEF